MEARQKRARAVLPYLPAPRDELDTSAVISLIRRVRARTALKNNRVSCKNRRGWDEGTGTDKKARVANVGGRGGGEEAERRRAGKLMQNI